MVTQTDGNLVTYKPGYWAVWASNTCSYWRSISSRELNEADPRSRNVMSNSRSGNQRRRFKTLLAGLLWSTGALVILCIACDSSSPSASSSPSTSIPPAQTHTAESDGYDFGPLAVIDNPGGSQALAGPGPVRIDEDCVTLTSATGTQFLLVWHVAEIAWDPESRTITYTRLWNRGDETVSILDGDIISVGGESLNSDVPIERNLTWLATPTPTCPGRPWAVSRVTKVASAPSP